MIGLAFALEHEAAGIVHELRDADSFRVGELPCRTGTLHGRKAVVAILGMGAEAAGRRAAILADHFSLEVLILAGYAGALVPAWKRNTALLAANYLSSQAEPWAARLPEIGRARLHSAAEVAGTPTARRELAEKGFEIVDMETGAVAVVTTARNIPLLPLRVISDEVGDVLPTAALAASFDLKRQRPDALRLLAYLATHPGEIAPFTRFVGHLGPAREALTNAVRALIV